MARGREASENEEAPRPPPRVTHFTKLRALSGDGAGRLAVAVEEGQGAGAVGIESHRGASLAVGAEQRESGEPVGGDVEADAGAMLIGEANRGRAVGRNDYGGARIAFLVHQGEAGLAVGGDPERGLTLALWIEQDDSGNAV